MSGRGPYALEGLAANEYALAGREENGDLAEEGGGTAVEAVLGRRLCALLCAMRNLLTFILVLLPPHWMFLSAFQKTKMSKIDHKKMIC